jgi:hypothetical protein
MTLTSLDIVERCRDHRLTFRKLDYWCHHGLFGPHNASPGTGGRRHFTEEDLEVALVLSRVSLAIDNWTGGRGGFVPIYADIAAAVRARDSATAVVAGVEGIELHVQLDTEDHDDR